MPTGAPPAISAMSGGARRFSSSFRSQAMPTRPATRGVRMTERLYYTDAYLREFDASVVRVDRRDGRTAVVLDRTAFYPTSGGQPFDVGTIGRLHVIDVVDDDTGEIAHLVDGDAPMPGDRFHGAIDWTRRFDHMQQHTGQHVLSAAIDRLFGVRTVSFHLGTESSTIDLSRELTRD